jgi:hypothetical protein
MISISLNQTESEKRLNRILYYVKVLRAQILNVLLIFLAIALYIAFGITGVYPTEEDAINSLRPHMDQPDRYAYILAMFVTFPLLIGFVVWLYISIVRVWRKSLKAQVIFGVIIILIFPFVAVLHFLSATTILTRYSQSSWDYTGRSFCGGWPIFLLDSGKYPQRQRYIAS